MIIYKLNLGSLKFGLICHNTINSFKKCVKGGVMKKLFVLFLSLLGLANVIFAPGNKFKVISQIDESTPLILEHAKDFQLKNQNMDRLAWHYSHYSHQSHYSHYSHESHYSHYSSRF